MRAKIKINKVCPFCNKEIVGYDYETREQIALDSLKKVEKARIINSEMQYV